MRIAKNSKLVFIGDSITDCGREHPVGEGLWDASYGNGYVNLIRGFLAVDYTDYNIRVINMGTSGNNVLDLKSRWQSDVFGLKPDWVSVMIGVNDVWRQFDSPLQKETHVGLAQYSKTLDGLIEETKSKVSGIVLISPFFIEPRKDDPMRKMVDEYGAAMKETAKKHGTVFVDIQAAIDKLTGILPTASIAWDRVHPNITGHLAIAKAFMEAVS